MIKSKRRVKQSSSLTTTQFILHFLDKAWLFGRAGIVHGLIRRGVLSLWIYALRINCGLVVTCGIIRSSQVSCPHVSFSPLRTTWTATVTSAPSSPHSLSWTRCQSRCGGNLSITCIIKNGAFSFLFDIGFFVVGACFIRAGTSVFLDFCFSFVSIFSAKHNK